VSHPDASPNAGDRPVISFGVFADAHYAEKVYADRHCEDSLARLRVCIDIFNARGLSMAVNLGDIIDTAEDKEAERGHLAEVSRAFALFRGERHTVLGNHDVETFTKEEFLYLCGDDNPLPYYSFDHDRVHFVVLDSNCHQDGTDFAAGDFEWADAWLSQAQLLWLAHDLQEAQGERKPVIVFCHGNLDHHVWQGGPDPHVVRNAPRVRSILEGAGNVQAVIQGHYHDGRRSVQGGISYITLAAMVVGSGVDSNAYAIVSLHENGLVAVEGFGRQETFSIGPGRG